MLTPFRAFQLYQAIKLHFSSDSYNCVKYQYKTSVKEASFLKRRDRYSFAKISKRFTSEEDLIDFYVAHFGKDPKCWIGDLVNCDDDDIYQNRKRIKESIGYALESDMTKLMEDSDKFDDVLIAKDEQYPRIVQMFLGGDINIETVCVINNITNFLKREKVHDTLVYPEVVKRITKYSYFVHVDLKRAKNIILKCLHND